ncbi:MAG: ATP-dependent RecD-like DNA helicase [Candidatus Hydrogenedentes bacterium]|nr:ATP-dependent RecD-like DNA helicase [Candidatus Hydrogenedentota bacterium]
MPQTTEQNGQTDLDPLVTIEGAVERIVFESADTNFIVGRLREKHCRELVTFVGNLMAISPGETVRLRGRWVEDRKFGRQLRVEAYETILPATVDGIEKYLGSGLIDGIGPKFAERLVKAFGAETLRIIDERPDRLRTVPGIGAKRAKQIRDAWVQQKAIQSIMVFLQGHGVSASKAVRIYKRYGDAAVAVLRENPYRLAEDVAGISFKIADSIAAQLGIDQHSPKRLAAGMKHILGEASGEGHLYLPEDELLGRARELLGAGDEGLRHTLVEMIATEQVHREGSAVYAQQAYLAEENCARLLKRLIASPGDPIDIRNMDNALQWVERQHNIELSPEQREAIATALGAKVMVITGGPGTGKTTVINSLLAILDRKSVNYFLAAPTGRAAKRMEEATGREASTLHRLLEFSPKLGGFARNEYDPINADYLVIDESSMLDIYLFQHVLKALPPFTRLLFVGDIDQLPSVGPGNVLMDIIASTTVPVVRLKTVFRQAQESGIISGAHQVNTGRTPSFNTTDFFFIERRDPDQARDTVLELVAKRMPERFGLDPRRDIQVLVPMHRGAAGVTRINEALQSALNPDGAPVARRTFRVGDKVMQFRNNYEIDVYNGDIGVIRMADEEAGELEVSFDDRTVIYPNDALDDLGLAYAMTIHKSQGSEYPAVVIVLLPQHFMMLQRNVLYTAITRGKKYVVIVGDGKAVSMAVRNSQISRRNTMLAERLRNTV